MEENKRKKQNNNSSNEFISELLEIRRVTKVTTGGKKLRFRAIVIIGNKKGRVGLGIAKGRDVAQAVEKAEAAAKKNIIEIPIVEETIPYEVKAKFGAAEVLLRPQKKGRGLVAGGTVRIICQMGGIKNISSKILGATRNKINNAKATIKALKMLKINNKNLYANTSIETQSQN